MKPSLTAGPEHTDEGDVLERAPPDPGSSSGRSESAEEEQSARDEILEVDFFYRPAWWTAAAAGHMPKGH